MGETLYDNGEWELRTRPDDPNEDYSLRNGALYVEFSSVKWLDGGPRLVASGGYTYASVRYDPKRPAKSIPKALHEELMNLE